jgi:hypothetical protein
MLRMWYIVMGWWGYGSQVQQFFCCIEPLWLTHDRMSYESLEILNVKIFITNIKTYKSQYLRIYIGSKKTMLVKTYGTKRGDLERGGGWLDLCCSHQVPIGFLSSFKHVFQVPIVFHNTSHLNKKVVGLRGGWCNSSLAKQNFYFQLCSSIILI